MLRLIPVLCAPLIVAPAIAGTIEVAPQPVTEWKPVYGQIETRDRVPARARIGGTIMVLEASEGDQLSAGGRVAVIEDTKLSFQIASFDARLEALASRLDTAASELSRGEQLKNRGVITTQRLEELQTAVSVIRGEISSLESERLVVQRQVEEGEVLAPEGGIVLQVPVSVGSVVVPGETVAVVGGGGVFLRLAVPERHAADLSEGDIIEIGNGDQVRQGELVKLYPQIEGGRVQADVEVAGLDTSFVGLRVPVRLPVGERMALLVPENALSRSSGLDFVTVETDRGPVRRVVVPGEAIARDGKTMREILSGIVPGDKVVTPDE